MVSITARSIALPNTKRVFVISGQCTRLEKKNTSHISLSIVQGSRTDLHVDDDTVVYRVIGTGGVAGPGPGPAGGLCLFVPGLVLVLVAAAVQLDRRQRCNRPHAYPKDVQKVSRRYLWAIRHLQDVLLMSLGCYMGYSWHHIDQSY
ncbi:hypothetical protein EAG_12612 [Camponotus floridanus]|uniref:Uncharacterized protein n=1 Tax=Camponotus floridanus TaxID=104421 RepID=E2AJE2_CAMFO|nr:hypothetical protein EAG_12612 [Camponotus floridanus]